MIRTERTKEVVSYSENTDVFAEVRSCHKKIRIKNRKLLDEIKQLPCVMCLKGPCDPSHITPVGAGGDDTEDNVAPMCRPCHREWEDMGRITTTRNSPRLRSWLRQHGREDILSLLERP